MNSQAHLNPTKLSIISVPRSKYWIFVSSILSLLYQESEKGSNESDSLSESDDEDEIPVHQLSLNGNSREGTPVDNSSKAREKSSNNSSEVESDNLSVESCADYNDHDNYFFHIAFTPEECTIICSKSKTDTLFRKPIQLCHQLGYNDVQLIEENFINLQINSDGSDRSLQIIQLTRPLSDNGISLFFLSSHFGDIVLIPYRYKERVLDILTEKKYQYSDLSNSFIITNDVSIYATDSSKLDWLKDTQTRPHISSNIKLLLTGSRSGEVTNTIVKAATIIATDKVPPYFSITRTSINEVSLILPKSQKTRASLGFSASDIIGSELDVIVPIIVDLSLLPFDSPGIVAGLASKIMWGVDKLPNYVSYPFEMNYLSMARAGIIMIPEENVLFVSKVLNDEIDEENEV